LVDGTPELLPLAVDAKQDLVPVPGIAAPAWSSLPLADLVGTELLTPPPHRFLGYENAPLRQKILDIPEAEAETDGRPRSQGRKTFASH
jgi:hypothetical protein